MLIFHLKLNLDYRGASGSNEDFFIDLLMFKVFRDQELTIFKKFIWMIAAFPLKISYLYFFFK